MTGVQTCALPIFNGSGPGDFPNAEAYYAGAISLPIYYELGETQQDHVVATLKEALR